MPIQSSLDRARAPEYLPDAEWPAIPPRTKPVSLRIVFVGDAWEGSTSGMRADTLQSLGHSVRIVPRARPQTALLPRVFDGLYWRAGYPRDHGLNGAILNRLASAPADVLWCDRPLDVKPETLRAAKKIAPALKLVAYSLDDMAGPHNQSAYYLSSIPLYDLHVTTKSYNVAELQALGAREVLFVNNAFSPRVHFPVEVTPEQRQKYGGPVGFIGAYEEERAAMVIALAKSGVPVRIWGGWPKKLRGYSKNLQIEDGYLWGDSYRIAISSFDVNLGFLRKLNRDLQTTRSVEVPACGGFLLAERTSEHVILLREDVQAAYFNTVDELIKKTNYYLQHEGVRKRIALDGLQRVLSMPCTYDAQLQRILEHVC
jgi:spore maturation protein CgeB